MKAKSIASFIDNYKGYLKEILYLRSFWISLVFLFFIVFSLFRWMSYRELQKESNSISILLRDEYANANSYLLSKRITDLEKINMIKCVVLIEKAKANREYYNTYKNNHSCSTFEFLRAKREFQAINGLIYSLEFEKPISLKSLLLEFLFYIIGLLVLIKFYQKILYERKDSLLKIKALSMEQELLEGRASQVKHDIASPITAIKTVIGMMPMQGTYKELLEKALKRTEDIFEDLSLKESCELNGKAALSVVHLNQLFDEILEEKRIEWKNQVKVNNMGSEECEVFAKESVLLRVLSNTLNNSFEAMVNKDIKTLNYSITSSGDFASLEIIDSGKGIPNEILDKVLEKGFSYGKKTGSGLGLYHAKESIRSWGGDITIESEQNKGVRIVFTFRQVT